MQLTWAPRINFTARTGWHVDRLVPALDKALGGWETRIGTGQLNAFLGRLVAEHPHPVRSGKQARILFATQPSTAPPTFVLFTTGNTTGPHLHLEVHPAGGAAVDPDAWLVAAGMNP